MDNREYNALRSYYKLQIETALATGAIKVNKDGKIKKSVVVERDIYSGRKIRIQAEGKSAEDCAKKLADAYKKHVEKVEEFTRPRTFGEVAREWYSNEIEHASISEGNKKNYKTDLNNHILPALGQYDITQLMKKDYQAFLNSFENRGASMVKKIRMIILQILRYAMENRYIQCTIINLKMPAVTPIKKRNIFTDDQIKLLIRAQKEYPTAIVFVAMLATGLRPCELYNVKISDIDFEQKVLRVTKSKTDNGIRVIPLCDYVVDLILKDRETLQKNKVKTEYVFHQSYDPTKPHTQNSLNHNWKTTLRTMDIINGCKLYRNKIVESTIPNKDELTPYNLRHTFCTMLNDIGISEYFKRRLMGHTLNSSITDGVYTHSSEDKVVEAAKPFLKHIDKLFNSASV